MGVAYGTQLHTYTAFTRITTLAEPPDSKKPELSPVLALHYNLAV
jgi:hypothetical protein